MDIEVYKKIGGSFIIDISLQLEEGSFNIIAGPSGGGKTTLLKLTAGIISPFRGKINYKGKLWFHHHHKTNVPIQKRNLSFVFQDYALFPNMTVEQNLLFALDNKNENSLFEELVNVFEIRDLLKQLPESLSGGQQQRVALARALIRKSELLLLDEPLSAMDTTLKFKIQEYLKSYHQKYRPTVLMVSHNYNEVFHLAENIIELEAGKVKLSGSLSSYFNTVKKAGDNTSEIKGEVLTVNNETVQLLVGSNILKIPASSLKEKHDVGDVVYFSLKDV